MGVRWTTESVGDYYGRIEASSPELIGKSSNKISKRMTKHIKANTPKGKRGKWETYKKEKRYGIVWDLKRDIKQADIHYAGNHVWESGTYTDVPYAPHVEYRTRGGYPIVPIRARALRFFWEKEGKWVFFKRVKHPGSDGHYMFIKGTMETQAESYGILEKELLLWLKKFTFAKRARQRVQKFHWENGVLYSYETSKKKTK